MKNSWSCPLKELLHTKCAYLRNTYWFSCHFRLKKKTKRWHCHSCFQDGERLLTRFRRKTTVNNRKHEKHQLVIFPFQFQQHVTTRGRSQESCFLLFPPSQGVTIRGVKWRATVFSKLSLLESFQCNTFIIDLLLFLGKVIAYLHLDTFTMPPLFLYYFYASMPHPVKKQVAQLVSDLLVLSPQPHLHTPPCSRSLAFK